MFPPVTKFIALVSLVSLASLLAATAQPPAQQPPKDATLYDGKLYQFIDAKVSWDEAEKKCVELGGILVSIKTKETHEFLLKLSKGKCFWAGASDKLTEGVWLWRDGTKVSYSDWAPNEPDDWKGKEDSMVINWPGSRFKDGKWADTKSDYQKPVDGFICEWKSPAN